MTNFQLFLLPLAVFGAFWQTLAVATVHAMIVRQGRVEVRPSFVLVLLTTTALQILFVVSLTNPELFG